MTFRGKMNFKLQPIFLKRQILFIIASFLVALIAFAFAWYINFQVFLAVQATGTSIMEDLGTNSTTTAQVDSFFTNAANYIAVFALIGFSTWAWQYSQKRGYPVYG